jgi:chromosome segregation ATPase
VHARPDQETSQNTAQQHQQLLNDNARLREALASLQDQHARLEKAKAVQAQEMDEMMMTVKELEAFMASADKGDLTETVAALEAALAERDEKILQLREEAAARRKEFREVTQHQEQTIDQLKMLHEQRIAEMEEQRSEMEERLLSSAGSETINAAEVAKQLSALEAVCDEMQRGSEQAKEAMEVAQSRITQLEEENARLHDEVIESRTAAVAQPSEGAKRLVKKSSLDQLPQNHPQRTSAFGMLEGEVSRLEQENAQIKRSNAQREQATHATIEALEQELQQLRANTSNESSHSLRAQLSRERAQRIALEDRYTELERQLEDTIMQIEQASLPARTVSRSLSTSPSLSIRIPPPVQTPDPVRSPRPHRGKLTDREDEMVEPMSAGHASCEYCGKVGHDMLSCKEVFGTPQAKQPEQPIPAAGSGGVKRFTERKEQIIQQEQMATPPRMDSSGQLWCSYCQRYGIHATEECPDADEQF